jgi:hypothetical protein
LISASSLSRNGHYVVVHVGVLPVGLSLSGSFFGVLLGKLLPACTSASSPSPREVHGVRVETPFGDELESLSGPRPYSSNTDWQSLPTSVRELPSGASHPSQQPQPLHTTSQLTSHHNSCDDNKDLNDIAVAASVASSATGAATGAATAAIALASPAGPAVPCTPY